MKTRFTVGNFALTAWFALCNADSAATRMTRDYSYKPVPFTAVHLKDNFWAPRLETNRLVTIPCAFGKCQESGRMYHFERAAAVLRGENISDRSHLGVP
jgi:uncharacterized protein